MNKFFVLLLLLCGCSYSKPLGRVMHSDGTNWTAFYYVRAGGALGPGLGAIVSQTTSGNPPVVLVQGTGQAAVPNLLGNATSAATGLLAGYALGKDSGGGNVTVIEGEPAAPMIEPPSVPPSRPVHPPNGRPPNNRPPHNRPK